LVYFFASVYDFFIFAGSIASVAVASFVIAGIFAGGVSFHGMILDSTGMKISVTHLDGYFASVLPVE
jgi:hypothetical protein